MKKINAKGYFVSVRVRTVLRFLKRTVWREICEEENTLKNTLELQCLVDDLDEVDTGHRNQKKNILLHIMFFF